MDSLLFENQNVSTLWVFGYGSVLWKTGFEYTSMRFGYIEGFQRRFWQGSCTHRGTPEKPGRVSTLTADPHGRVWGAAFELVGAQMITKALTHLGLRECSKGGYTFTRLTFTDRQQQTLSVLTFLATPGNDLYLGPGSITDLANQIIECKGMCGHNVEYVTRLADFMRRHIPEEQDSHLFETERTIKMILKRRHLSVDNLIIGSKSTMPDHIAACVTSAESDFRCKCPGVCLSEAESEKSRTRNEDCMQTTTRHTELEALPSRLKVKVVS